MCIYANLFFKLHQRVFCYLMFPTEESLLNQEDDWHLDLDFSCCKSVAQASRLNHADFLRITPPEHDIISDAPFSPDLVFVVSI